MKNVYDNGEICLGEVKAITKYIKENGEDLEYYNDLLNYLKELNDDDIVAINYDNGMGYSIEYWNTKDIITQKEI